MNNERERLKVCLRLEAEAKIYSERLKPTCPAERGKSEIFLSGLSFAHNECLINIFNKTT
jgi:hypothetical protein